MNTLKGSCEKTCTQQQKKAPVFKIGDIVADSSGNIFTINCIFHRWGDVAYAFIQREDSIERVAWHSGHNLKRMSVVGKKQ